MKSRENMNLKKIIVDFKKLNNHLLDLLVQEFPYGYDENDIIRFKNMQGEWVECVEVRTEDTLYLVKVGKRLETAMEVHSAGDMEDEFISEQDQEETEVDSESEEDQEEKV